MTETTRPSIEDIRSAVSLSGNPAPGATIHVKRAGKPVIPIQVILRELRAAYPETIFSFGDQKPIAD